MRNSKQSSPYKHWLVLNNIYVYVLYEYTLPIPLTLGLFVCKTHDKKFITKRVCRKFFIIFDCGERREIIIIVEVYRRKIFNVYLSTKYRV